MARIQSLFSLSGIDLSGQAHQVAPLDVDPALSAGIPSKAV